MNTTYSPTRLRALLAGLVLTLHSGATLATLGEAPSASPPRSSPGAVPAARRLSAVPASSLYTVHEGVLDNGTRVREFATPAGRVFAVSWRGPVLPDLQALLGSHFKTFQTETDQTRHSGRRGAPVNLRRTDLVLKSSGRMGNFFGHAYVPALIPSNVDVQDVLK